jgi:hypothetical protein
MAFSPKENYADRATPLLGEVSANFWGERVSCDQRSGFKRPLISVSLEISFNKFCLSFIFFFRFLWKLYIRLDESFRIRNGTHGACYRRNNLVLLDCQVT